MCRRHAGGSGYFSHSVSLSNSKRSWRPRGLGKPGKTALGSGAVGQGGNTSLCASLIGLSPGPGPADLDLDLDLGFLFPSSSAVTLLSLPVPCQVPREGRIGFPGSLQPLRRIDSGCRTSSTAQFKVFPIGLSCKCCTVGVTVCTVGVFPHHDACRYFDTVDCVLWMETAAPVQHRSDRDLIGSRTRDEGLTSISAPHKVHELQTVKA